MYKYGLVQDNEGYWLIIMQSTNLGADEVLWFRATDVKFTERGQAGIYMAGLEATQ